MKTEKNEFNKVSIYEAIYENNGVTVKMSNGIVRSAQDLTASEKKLILVAISKVNKVAILVNKPIKIFARDLINASDSSISKHEAHRILRDSSKKLMPRTIKFNEKYGDGIIEREVNWLQERAVKRDDFVEILFTDRIFNNLTFLDKEFTKYTLKSAMRLDGKYSIRLFEMLMQWASVGQLIISEEDLIDSLNLPQSYIEQGLLRTRIINPSLKEYKEKLEFHVNFGKSENGLLKFTFEKRLTREEIESKKKEANRVPSLMADKKQFERIAQRLAEAEFTDVEGLARKAVENAKSTGPRMPEVKSDLIKNAEEKLLKIQKEKDYAAAAANNIDIHSEVRDA